MAMRSSYIGIPWLSLAEMATSSLHDRGPLPSSSDLILLVFPSHGGDSITGLPGPGNYNYTIGPGTVGMLLRTLSTVSIHESGHGLKGGLAEIAPIGKFITERGSDDELLASDVPEELKEEGFRDGEKDKGTIGEGRRRKSAGMFNL